jgi:hypothetical protein
MYLGSYQHEVDAAKAFDVQAYSVRQDRAKLNFPECKVRQQPEVILQHVDTCIVGCSLIMCCCLLSVSWRVEGPSHFTRTAWQLLVNCAAQTCSISSICFWPVCIGLSSFGLWLKAPLYSCTPFGAF